MEFNKLIYPAPEPSVDIGQFICSKDPNTRSQLVLVDAYKSVVANGGRLPKKIKTNDVVEYQIPCMYMSTNCPEYNKIQIQLKNFQNGQNTNKPAYMQEEEKKTSSNEKSGHPNQFASPDEKLIVYFHGNAEDLGHNEEFMKQLRQYMNISVLAMEYPGYGFHAYRIQDEEGNLKKKLSCSAKKIITNGTIVMDHVLKPADQGGMGYKVENVILFGRSIGTGPATQFASIYKPRALITMSAYTSIKDVTINVAGKFLSNLVSVHFNNLQAMKRVKCPVLLIHGVKDPLILSHHSETLFKALQDQLKAKDANPD